jgi:hypothetical protein
MKDRPSWLRWPPNCCEACQGWAPDRELPYVGICADGASLDCGTPTDSRYRCPSFKRKDGI